MYLKHIRLSLFLFFCNSPYTFHLMGSILSERQFQAEVNIPHYASFKDRRTHFTKKKHFLLNFHLSETWEHRQRYLLRLPSQTGEFPYHDRHTNICASVVIVRRYFFSLVPYTSTCKTLANSTNTSIQKSI